MLIIKLLLIGILTSHQVSVCSESEPDNVLRQRGVQLKVDDLSTANELRMELSDSQLKRQQAEQDLRIANDNHRSARTLGIAGTAFFAILWYFTAGYSAEYRDRLEICTREKRTTAELLAVQQLEHKKEKEEFEHGFHRGLATCRKEGIPTMWVRSDPFALGQATGFHACNNQKKELAQRKQEENRKKKFSKIMMGKSRKHTYNPKPRNGK